MREPCRERGFTLIELMIVVAVIAVLAAIVVPMWTKETRKGKGRGEVTPMFAELTTKLEQYKNEAGTYLTVAECPSGGPNSAGYNFITDCKTGGSGWETLRIQTPSSTMFCSYQIESGLASDTLTVPSGFVTSQGGTGAEPALATAWWYVLATCNEDGQSSGANSTFYSSSLDSKLQAQNEGK